MPTAPQRRSFFAGHGAAFDLRVQFCPNLETMPVEDASVQWDEAQSPYRTVARLTMPPQDAFSEARYPYYEQRLAFNPIHGLEPRRPLGGVNRVRVAVYQQTQDFRQRTNHAAPGSSAEVPD